MMFKVIRAPFALVIAVVGLMLAGAVSAQEAYEHGNGALELFDEEGQANSPQWVQIWLYIMLASFALGLLFVWKRVEARWVVGGFIVAGVLSGPVGEALGLLPLSGFYALCHLIGWSPALYMLLTRKTISGRAILL